MPPIGTYLPTILPNKGIPVSLSSSYIGIRSVPLIALAHRTIPGPNLTFFQQSFQTKVLWSRSYDYSEVKQVDARKSWTSILLTFQFKNKLFTFLGNLFFQEDFPIIVEWLQRNQVPLSPRAQKLFLSLKHVSPP